MTATLEQSPGAQAAGGNNKLWAVVGALGVAVVGLAGTLVYQGTRPAAPTTPVAALTVPAGTALPPAAGLSAKESMVQDGPEPPVVSKPAEKKAVAPAKPAPVKAAPAPRPAAPVVAANQGQAQPLPAPVAPRVVCTTCGTVENVSAVERKPAGSGLGVVAGGVVGGLLGNQIGKGNGRTAATVLGAIGGGVAGNAIEKNIKKETVYQIAVRMEDGSVRTVEKAAPVAVGSRVTMDGGTLRTADGAVVPALPAPKQAAPAQTGPGYVGG